MSGTACSGPSGNNSLGAFGHQLPAAHSCLILSVRRGMGFMRPSGEGREWSKASIFRPALAAGSLRPSFIEVGNLQICVQVILSRQPRDGMRG